MITILEAFKFPSFKFPKVSGQHLKTTNSKYTRWFSLCVSFAFEELQFSAKVFITFRLLLLLCRLVRVSSNISQRVFQVLVEFGQFGTINGLFCAINRLCVANNGLENPGQYMGSIFLYVHSLHHASSVMSMNYNRCPMYHP